jgi:hypothetical protein
VTEAVRADRGPEKSALLPTRAPEKVASAAVRVSVMVAVSVWRSNTEAVSADIGPEKSALLPVRAAEIVTLSVKMLVKLASPCTSSG